MRQHDFEAQHAPLWLQLEQWLQPAEGRQPGPPPDDFAGRYRELCHHLALARQRRYGSHLVARLNELVRLCHHRLYRHRDHGRALWLRFLLIDFPVTLRANGRLVALAAALLFVPALLLGLGCYLNDELVYSVMSPAQVSQFDAMYEPGQHRLGREREADTDLLMFGFYIRNNIGVGFRSFAGGMLFGIGTLFFMLYNGVLFGAVAGHLTRVGYSDTFWPFVIGHGAFELTAIVFCGAAGFKLGWALIDPGPLRRIDALRHASRDAVTIVYGAALMLVVAAFLEAFWSSNAELPIATKVGVGAAMWLLVLLYCGCAGRPRAA